MLETFKAYTKHGKALAEAQGLAWDILLEADGTATIGWNLTEAVGATPPPSHYLRDLGHDNKTLSILNRRRTELGQTPITKSRLSTAWQDLIKTATCDQLFFRRNTTTHVVNNIIRSLKVLATCAGNLEPWQLNADTVRESVALAQVAQASGMLANMVLGVVKHIIDANHLAEACPLYPAVSAKRLIRYNRRKTQAFKSKDQLLSELEQRKRDERLPDRKAFWELIRIVFTEHPETYTDALRFAAIKVMVLCGLRIGEAVMLPADWKRSREYYDRSGKPAGALGGYSRALMLRHFAEKQQSVNSDSMILYESAQYIPAIFEEILAETLDGAVKMTQPLRDTLKRQVKTGRLLPWYAPEALVPVVELYTCITGNPFWLDLPKETIDDFVGRYRQTFNPEVLKDLSQYMNNRYLKPGGLRKLSFAIYVYFNRILNNKKQHTKKLVFRRASGSEYTASRMVWSEVYLRIDELEEYLAATSPTKLSDRQAVRLDNGELKPWEFLFLIPKRSLAEERNGGYHRYYPVLCCRHSGPRLPLVGSRRAGQA